MDRLADDGEIFRILQRDVGGPSLLRRRVGQTAISSAAPTRSVDHVTFFGAAGLSIDIPILRRSGDQHDARHRAHFAEAIVFGCGGRAAASHLQAENAVVVRGIYRRGFHANFGPVTFEFFGQHHRQRRVNPLPHLRVIRDDGDGIVGAHTDEGVGRKCMSRVNQRCCAGFIPLRNVRADQQPAAQGYRGLQKIAALELSCDRHFAARCA